MPDQTYVGPVTNQCNTSPAIANSNLNRRNSGFSAVEIQEVEKGVNPNRLNYKATVTLAEDPPAPAPPPTPDSSWTKSQIVAWLTANGVALEKKASDALTKAELLELVDDVLSPAPPE